MLITPLLLIVSLVILSATANQIPAATDNDAKRGSLNRRYDLMIAFQKSYYPQFLNESNGEWQTYPVKTIVDVSDKTNILNFCKQVYPNKDIKNYVKDNNQIRINGWCSVKTPWKKVCKKFFDIQPYRCLEQFQTDALLVPDNCVFDHIQNQSKCWSFDRWNKTAQLACRDRGFKIESFAMLLPCQEISAFSGVEFVCCPKKSDKQSDYPITDNDEILDFKDDLTKSDESADQFEDNDNDNDNVNEKDQLEKEEDEVSEDDTDYKYEDSVELAYSSVKVSTGTPVLRQVATRTTTVSTTTVTTPAPDPYFSKYDSRHEHSNYISAIKRAEKRFNDGIRDLKNQRDDFEEQYQILLVKDYKEADEYRNKTTELLKKKHTDLEEERDSAKDQIMEMHKERVAANINQLVKNATVNFWLVMKKSKLSEKDVYPVIIAFLKAHNKDRSHTYARYKHLLEADFEWAREKKGQILEHLLIIGTKVNESINYLKDKQESIWDKLKDSVDSLDAELQLNSPIVGSVLEINKESEDKMLEDYIMDAEAKRAAFEQEKYRKRLEKEKIKKEQLRKMRMEHDKKNEQKLEHASQIGRHSAVVFDDELVTQPKTLQAPSSKPMMVKIATTFSSNKSPEITEVKIEKFKRFDNKDDNEAADQTMEDVSVKIHEERLDEPVAHPLFRKLAFEDRRHIVSRSLIDPAADNMYFRLVMGCTCLISLVLMVTIMAKKRSSRSPQRQGFIEVDQTISPEERHVTNMQINGYENPTYKYFEVKD